MRPQQVVHFLRPFLTDAEHQHQIRIQAVDQTHQRFRLALFRSLNTNLPDRFHNRLFFGDIYNLAVGRQAAPQFIDLFRNRSGTKHSLMLRVRHGDQFPGIVHKALSQHLVHLIQDQIGDTPQIGIAFADMIQ